MARPVLMSAEPPATPGADSADTSSPAASAELRERKCASRLSRLIQKGLSFVTFAAGGALAKQATEPWFPPGKHPL